MSVTRHTVTTAYHPTPAPCDLCATVAPLFRVDSGDWVCASCHDWAPVEAARAVASLPARPCPDCDAPQGDATTPTGIPITWCRECSRRHPVTRRHCAACGRPSLFIHEGQCRLCRGDR